MKKLILIFALLLGVLMMFSSCSFFFDSETGEIIDPATVVGNWIDTNEIPLGVEILMFIISLPIILLIAAVGLVLSAVFGIIEFVGTAIYLVVIFIGYVLVMIKSLLGI